MLYRTYAPKPLSFLFCKGASVRVVQLLEYVTLNLKVMGSKVIINIRPTIYWACLANGFDSVYGFSFSLWKL